MVQLMIIDFFPHYHVDDYKISSISDHLEFLSIACKMCNKFKNKQLCSTQKDKIIVCSKGLCIYWDSKCSKQYFSLRVKGIYNAKKIHCKDESLKISKKFLELYLQYVRQESQLIFYDVARTFFKNIDKIFYSLDKDIKRELANSNSALCCFSHNQIESFNSEMDNFAEMRQDAMQLMEDIQKTILTLFPAKNMETKGIKSCIEDFRICVRCVHFNTSECYSISYDTLSGCPTGGFRYCTKNICFYGSLRSRDCFFITFVKQNKCKEELLKNILRNEASFLNIFVSFQRFLHDVAQYFVGLRNIIPESDDSYPKNHVLDKNDIYTASVLCDAINALKNYCFETIFGKLKIIEIEYEPYKLFDKYAICFTNQYRKIILKRTPNTPPVNVIVRGEQGFEVVVLNLLLNAIKYLPSSTTSHRDILVAFSLNDDLEITIDSYGPPVHEDELINLGKIGFRGRQAIAYKIPGEGLGLNLMKEICTRNGYLLSFNSDLKNKITVENKEYALFTAKLIIPRRFHISKRETSLI